MLSKLVKLWINDDTNNVAIKNTHTNFLVKDSQCLMTRYFEVFVVP